jgi:segregation and condensation protein A
MFTVSSHKFTGPLGLLLTMIEGEKLDITEVALAKIADQYVDYVKKSEKINTEEIADFLLIAARLLWLKSKALLPYLIKEEETEIDDLEQQLRMYKEFAEASLKITDLLSQGNSCYFLEFNRQNRRKFFDLPLFIPPKGIDQKKIKETMVSILNQISQQKKLPEKTIEDSINIEDRILFIRQLLKKQISFTFKSLIKKNNSKNEIVVSLLAILELIKQKELDFEQDSLFKDIHLLPSNSN